MERNSVGIHCCKCELKRIEDKTERDVETQEPKPEMREKEIEKRKTKH